MAESRGDDSGLIVATVPEEQGRLMCIQYPGFVDNVDRAIASLGGMKVITQAYHEKNHGLEVRLRPEDKFCKPAQARVVPVTNLVLRVRRRRRRTSRGEGQVEGDGSSDSFIKSECNVEVLGLVKQNFEFTGMVDYQVLPPGLNGVSYKADTVDPNIFQINEPFDETFDSSKVPLFLPPWTFSKFDKPSNYAHRPDFQHKTTTNTLAGNCRQRRQVFAIGIPFDHKGPVPSQPHPDAPSSSQTKILAIKKLFEERPVWSRSGIQCRIKLHDVMVRSILALVSYYFTSGPWKMLWVRLGYDPRSTVTSKIYQCLDYRIPRDIAVIESQRNRIRPTPLQAQKREFQLTEDQDSVRLAEVMAEGPPAESDGCAVFTVDQLPRQRQLFYQLCDLRDDTLQAVIHSNDGRETECTETNGWCEDGAYDKLRKLLGDMIRKTAEKVKVECQQNTETSSGQSMD